MSELVEFIRGRLDADEQTARAAFCDRAQDGMMPAETDDGVWSTGSHAMDECRVEGVGILIYDEGGHNEFQAAHIARHDPARVLAEVNAKRAIVDMLADAEAVIARIGPDLDKPGDAAEWANYHAWRQAVEALAQPYAGEPGWRDEWGTQ